MNLFDIGNICFEFGGYSMSYLELSGVIAGGIAVFLSARANIWSWPLGLVNVFLFFFLFYQVQLYPDMFLQVFFFITNLLGWWRWSHPRVGEEDQKKELRISWMPVRVLVLFFALAFLGAVLFGAFAGRLHNLFPGLFTLPSAYPYLDSVVTVVSIGATYLMVQKKIECWLAWILADVVATYLYFAKGILLVGVEYLLFCGIAAFGFWRWQKQYRMYSA